MNAWWTAESGTWIGALGGAGLGILGGTLGGLAGALAPRGKGRRVILTSHVALLTVSALALLTGLSALGLRQPYHVWYPLTLVGGIGTLVLGPLLPAVRRRYR